MSEKYMIEAEHVFKNYDKIIALNDISLSVSPGEIIGLIGPDGAGKSTLMKIILSLEKIDEGKVRVMDQVLPKGKQFIRNHIGYMPEVFSLYSDLSVEENLKFYFRIHKMKSAEYEDKINRLYKFNRLKKFSGILAGQLSGGMKQKLALSCALMHDPSLLILDEPTTGVDPLSRKEFWKMLQELKRQGITILVSTPYMDEANQCDIIHLIHDGKILQSGEPSQLLEKYIGTLYEIRIDNPHDQVNNIQDLFPGEIVYLAGRSIHLSTKAVLATGSLKKIRSAIPDLIEINKIPVNLEDIFLISILSSGENHA